MADPGARGRAQADLAFREAAKPELEMRLQMHSMSSVWVCCPGKLAQALREKEGMDRTVLRGQEAAQGQH